MIGDRLLGEKLGKVWELRLPFSRRDQRERRFTDNAKRIARVSNLVVTQIRCTGNKLACILKTKGAVAGRTIFSERHNASA